MNGLWLYYNGIEAQNIAYAFENLDKIAKFRLNLNEIC